VVAVHNAHRSSTLTALAAAAAVLGAACASQPSPRTTAAGRPASQLWLTGASNVRHFSCRATAVSATLALVPGATVDSALLSERSAVGASVEVPVAGLDCGIGHMSADLHHALKAPVAPTIEFRVAGYTPSPDGSAALIDGTLQIAGVERPLQLVASLDRGTPGVVRLRGQQTIRPTDFGVTPPRRFFGLLRVRNEVTVHFDVTVVGEEMGRVEALRD